MGQLSDPQTPRCPPNLSPVGGGRAYRLPPRPAGLRAEPEPEKGELPMFERKTLTAAELAAGDWPKADPEEDATPRAVRFDHGTLEIIFSKQRRDGRWRDTYHVDLERLTDSAKALDAVLQVQGKAWARASLVNGFLDALGRACQVVHGNNAQGVFCPSGASRAVRWPRAGGGA